MRHRPTHDKGFSFIEILTALAVIAVMATITTIGFQNMYRASALKVARNEVYQALTDARNRTLASEEERVYGVQIATNSVTRFVGATFSATAIDNETYIFEGGVTATGTLVANGTSIIFTRLTGDPSATGTISLISFDGTATRTLTVHASGLIE